MPTVVDVLSTRNEDMPSWLHSAGTDFDIEMIDNFFSSRVVYYPGAGQDGRAFALFGATHSAHCFLHIDLGYSAEQVWEILNSGGKTSVRGYTPSNGSISIETLSRHLGFYERQYSSRRPPLQSALWTILQRRPDYSDDHGPKRLAFLHVQAEAVWFCSKIWEQFDKTIPFVVVLQDYLGKLWPTLGGTGDLNVVANRTALAEYLLVAENTEPWPQYEQISELTEKEYGMNHRRVRLYHKTGSQMK